MRSLCIGSLTLIGVIVAVSGAVTLRHISAEPDADMLDVLKAGCNQAVEAVSSGRGTVTVHQVNIDAPEGPVYETETRYKLAFAAGNYRLSTETTVLRNDAKPGIDVGLMRRVGGREQIEVAVAGDGITFLKKNGKRSLATIGCSTSKMAGLFLRTLVQDVRPGVGWLGKGLVDIGKLQASGIPLFSHATTSVVGREVIDGDECIMVQIRAIPVSGDQPTSTLVYWVDPHKGYAVPRTRYYLQGGGWAERTLVFEEHAELREYKPGIWYPVKTTLDHYSTRDPAKHYKDMSKVVSYGPDFEVNVPVGASELALDLPSGTEVYNEVLDAYYTVP